MGERLRLARKTVISGTIVLILILFWNFLLTVSVESGSLLLLMRPFLAKSTSYSHQLQILDLRSTNAPVTIVIGDNRFQNNMNSRLGQNCRIIPIEVNRFDALDLSTVLKSLARTSFLKDGKGRVAAIVAQTSPHFWTNSAHRDRPPNMSVLNALGKNSNYWWFNSSAKMAFTIIADSFSNPTVSSDAGRPVLDPIQTKLSVDPLHWKWVLTWSAKVPADLFFVPTHLESAIDVEGLTDHHRKKVPSELAANDKLNNHVAIIDAELVSCPEISKK